MNFVKYFAMGITKGFVFVFGKKRLAKTFIDLVLSHYQWQCVCISGNICQRVFLTDKLEVITCFEETGLYV